MSKQDRQGVRTATDLEQKYTFGKRFAEIMGVATDAQDKAEDLEEKLNNALTSEEIFNILTENGTLQGLFRGEDGELYVNANYIVALEYLFAKDITMSGKFTYTTKAFLEPEQPEIDTMTNHILGNAIIPSNRLPLYDFNNDGNISMSDVLTAQKAMLGMDSLAEWSGAVKTDVTLTIDLKNPQKAFRITGVNMWGRGIDSYMGVQATSVKHSGTADYVVEQGASDGFAYEKWISGKAACWATITTKHANGSILEAYRNYPFSFSGTPCVIATINAAINGAENLHYNAKAYSSTDTVSVWVHNALGDFASTYELPVAVYVVGRWK